MLKTAQNLKILLVEDDLAEADLIEELLSEAKDLCFEIKLVKRLKEGLNCLSQDSFDMILLDLGLPDSQGVDTLVQVKTQVPNIPIVILTTLRDQNIVVETVRQGAQDYLVKGQLESELLIRSIYCAIERHQLKENLRQKAQSQQVIGEIIEKIHSCLDLQEILTTTVEELKQLFQAEQVLIYHGQSEEDSILLASSQAENQFKYNPNININFDLIETCSLVNQENIKLNITNCCDSNQSKNYAWKILLKINGQTRIWGIIKACKCKNVDKKWQKWEIDGGQQITKNLAIAIQKAELYRTAKQQATLDKLTEIANRNQFDNVLQLEWLRLAREKQLLSLIMCDIDYFKPYNDYYGHVEGDQCLKAFASILKEVARRPADLPARYGGEEFAIILPNTDTQGAFKVAYNIKEKLASLNIPHIKSQVANYLTVSIGIATTIPVLDQDFTTLVKSADKALYIAKAEGKNRIVQC